LLEVGCLRVGSLVSFSLKVKAKNETPCEARKTKSTSGGLVSPFREVFEQCLSWIAVPEKPKESPPAPSSMPVSQSAASASAQLPPGPSPTASSPVPQPRGEAMANQAPASVATTAFVRVSPYRKYGHALFWSGVGLVAFGGLCAFMAKDAAEDHRLSGDPSDRDRSRSWAGGMYASFGLGAAAMAGGVVLWTLSPSRHPVSEEGGTKPSLFPLSLGAGASLSWSW